MFHDVAVLTYDENDPMEWNAEEGTLRCTDGMEVERLLVAGRQGDGGRLGGRLGHRVPSSAARFYLDRLHRARAGGQKAEGGGGAAVRARCWQILMLLALACVAVWKLRDNIGNWHQAW
jgi:hypothetical protein